MKFIWAVKDDLTTGEGVASIVCNNLGSSGVHALKFPEVVAFAVKMKIILIFVVMDRVNAFYEKTGKTM